MIDNKAKSKDKSNEISLKKKLVKYNIMGLKQYNNLVNNINININNISRSAKKDKFEPSFTNNNIINLNLILNSTSHNNNKNMDSLQIINDNPNKTKNKFKSINANKYYLNTEANYERIERHKKIFLDNVFKKHEYLRKNIQNKYKDSNTYNS